MKVLKSFVEIGATLCQDILCFHLICLFSGSINNKLKNSDNDFHYFLYAFFNPSLWKSRDFSPFYPKTLKDQTFQGAKCVYFEFEFQYIKIGKYSFPKKKEERGKRYRGIFPDSEWEQQKKSELSVEIYFIVACNLCFPFTPISEQTGAYFPFVVWE